MNLFSGIAQVPKIELNLITMKKMTIKQEAQYVLECQGLTATDQDIQRAMPTKVRHRLWRNRKHRGAISGWSIADYLRVNKLVKRRKVAQNPS